MADSMETTTEDEFYDYPCSNPIASALGDMWSNYTGSAFDGHVSLFMAYVCRFADYWSTKDKCASIEGYSSLTLGAFGLIGSLANVLTLWQRRFRSQSDFSLFRVVGYLEIVQMSFIITITSLAYFHCETSYTCAFIWAHIATTVNNICADGVDIIVFFLSVERTIACLLPHLFRRIHTPKFVCVVVFISVTLPAFFAICQAFEVQIVYSEDDIRFIDIPSNFSQTQFYATIVHINSVRLYSSVILITLATIASIIGFRTVSVRQRRLLHKDGSCGNNIIVKGKDGKVNSKEKLNESPGTEEYKLIDKNAKRKSDPTSAAASVKKRQTDLCCLQLCLAAPVVVNLLLYAMGLSTNYTFITGRMAFEKNLTYGQAMNEVEKAESFLLLRTSTNVSNVLAHALHFYLYLLFSANVRKGFVELLTSGVQVTTVVSTFSTRRAQKSTQG